MNIKQILQSLKSIFALDKNVVHLSGDETISGIKTFRNGITSYVMRHPSDNKYTSIFGGSEPYKWAWIELVGKDHSYASGMFEIIASDDEGVRQSLRGYPSGSLTWNHKDIGVIDSQGDGYVRYSSGLQICFKQYICNGNANTSITLPKPFINADYMITLTGYGNFCSITPNSTNKSGFSINNLNANSLFVNVISIGYWK